MLSLLLLLTVLLCVCCHVSQFPSPESLPSEDGFGLMFKDNGKGMSHGELERMLQLFANDEYSQREGQASDSHPAHVRDCACSILVVDHD